MSYVPSYNPRLKVYVPPPPPAITVHAQKSNKRPIGYLPWPEDEPTVTIDVVDISEHMAKIPKKHKRKKARP